MPPQKKLKVAGADDDKAAVVFHQLEDIVANILGWLCVEEIMGKRRVCKKWTEAVRKTIVPPSLFVVDSVARYNALTVMTEEMPNLQQIKICYLDEGHKWNDGEDPDEHVTAQTAEEWAADYADWISHDIEIISNFRELRELEIDYTAKLNGRYPFLFNSFPLIQKLTISNYEQNLNWHLGMLAGFPLLKELILVQDFELNDNISSLRVLKDTLETVTLDGCCGVEGNLMDLADFPHLKELYLDCTAVIGDIRDIGENDFSKLEVLDLPRGVYGANDYELQRISDAPDLVRAVHLFNKQRPALKIMEHWSARLSRDSPDCYGPDDSTTNYLRPRFWIRFVQAGPRIGYQWTTGLLRGCRCPCEVNWLDPEPDKESSDYGQYIEELQKIENVVVYKGFHQPPPEEEYHRLLEEFTTRCLRWQEEYQRLVEEES